MSHSKLCAHQWILFFEGILWWLLKRPSHRVFRRQCRTRNSAYTNAFRLFKVFCDDYWKGLVIEFFEDNVALETLCTPMNSIFVRYCVMIIWKFWKWQLWLLGRRRLDWALAISHEVHLQNTVNHHHAIPLKGYCDGMHWSAHIFYITQYP